MFSFQTIHNKITVNMIKYLTLLTLESDFQHINMINILFSSLILDKLFIHINSRAIFTSQYLAQSKFEDNQ